MRRKRQPNGECGKVTHTNYFFRPPLCDDFVRGFAAVLLGECLLFCGDDVQVGSVCAEKQKLFQSPHLGAPANPPLSLAPQAKAIAHDAILGRAGLAKFLAVADGLRTHPAVMHPVPGADLFRFAASHARRWLCRALIHPPTLPQMTALRRRPFWTPTCAPFWSILKAGFKPTSPPAPPRPRGGRPRPRKRTPWHRLSPRLLPWKSECLNRDRKIGGWSAARRRAQRRALGLTLPPSPSGNCANFAPRPRPRRPRRHSQWPTGACLPTLQRFKVR